MPGPLRKGPCRGRREEPLGEIVNLNRFRKAKERSDKEAQAAENRTKFGRTKEEKAREKALQDKARREIEGHKLDE